LYGSAYAASNTLSPTIGDGNSEIVVDSPDFNLFKTAFGSESDIPAGPPVYDVRLDFNLDAFIDAADFLDLEEQFRGRLGFLKFDQ